ncbi:MAG TPA: metalloregulator ArsR/SmtB family transcription factor [Solirubrobacteraceae bacterium]|nr:metalloregulator ArsR/SmtB family transcription factor [Solirubrobacteraceae bacterium]
MFDALGDPSRRRILELLREGPSPVGVLAGRLPIGRPAVSKHLKVLSDAGLAEHRAVGTSNVYALRGDGIETARRWLTESWDAVLGAYAVAAAREQPQRRDQPPRTNRGDAT